MRDATSITCDGVGITAKVMVKNDATFDATKGDLYAKLLESAEKHEVELSFEKRIVLQPGVRVNQCVVNEVWS